MKSQECRRVEESLWRYIDRELSAPQLAEISAHLKACGNCKGLYESRARDANLFRMAFTDAPFGEGFVERFHQRSAVFPPRTPEVAGEGNVPPALSPPVRKVRGNGLFSSPQSPPKREFWQGRGRPPGARGRRREHEGEGALRSALPEATGRARRLAGRLALAAALALIGALVIYGLSPRSNLGSLQVTGNLTFERGGRALPSVPGTVLAGDSIHLDQGSELKMRLDDGSLLSFDGPAQVVVDAASRARGPFHARLEEGRVRAIVEPRLGRELRISSSFPKASAVVVGTRFTMDVKKGLKAELTVEEGEVRFQGEEPYDSVRVNRGTGPYEVRVDQGRPRAVPVLSPPGPPEGAVASSPGHGEGAGASSSPPGGAAGGPTEPEAPPADLPDSVPDETPPEVPEADLPPPPRGRIPPVTDLPVDGARPSQSPRGDGN